MPIETKILNDKTIVITRNAEDSSNSAEVFRKAGAKEISFPTIEIVPPDDWKDFDNNIKKLSTYDFLIFTSVNAVKMFVKRCSELDYKINYDDIKVAVVGSKTALECEREGIPVTIIPDEFNAEGLLKKLLKIEVKDKNIFIPCSAIAREELPVSLREKGANVITVPIYNIAVPSKEFLIESIDKLCRNKQNLFIFTSPSTFKNFLKIMDITEPQKYFDGIDIAAIGPTTKSEIEEHGIKVNIMPEEYTMDGLLQSVIDYYLEHKR